MSKVLISLFLLSLVCFTQAAIDYPYFSQHDKRWGSRTLGEGPDSISDLGCLLTTTTSMVAYKGIEINGQTPDPSTMNTFLKSKDGFSGTILFYNAVEVLGFKFEGIVKGTSAIKNAMSQGKFVHLHVLNGRHWVLATGTTSSGFTVMDPGSPNTKSYKYSGVVGAAIYSYPSDDRIPSEQQEDFVDDVVSQAAIDYPYFSQHDKRWGSRTLGEGSASISDLGCLLTTTTSMVAYQGIEINGQTPDPSTMNTFLKSKDGFSGTILFYKAVEVLGFKFEGIVKGTSAIKNAMSQGKFVHLHVLNGRHWVLATGTTSSGFTVMDPGSPNTKSYKYSGVVGAAIYSYSSKNRMLFEQQEDVVDDIEVDFEVESDQSDAIEQARDYSTPTYTQQRLRRGNGINEA